MLLLQKHPVEQGCEATYSIEAGISAVALLIDSCHNYHKAKNSILSFSFLKIIAVQFLSLHCQYKMY